MIVDAPGAEEEDTKPGTTEVVLTEENAGEVLDLIINLTDNEHTRWRFVL